MKKSNVKQLTAQEKEIRNYCFNYGYETIMVEADAEPEMEIEEKTLLPTICDEPDDFYDKFGVDASWDDSAEYDGMAAALKELTGKDYSIHCDGYRVVGVVGTMEDAKKYAQELNNNMKW